MSLAKQLETVSRDVRYALRGLGRAPLLTFVAVLTSYLPARRAAAVEPAEALAAE